MHQRGHGRDSGMVTIRETLRAPPAVPVFWPAARGLSCVWQEGHAYHDRGIVVSATGVAFPRLPANRFSCVRRQGNMERAFGAVVGAKLLSTARGPVAWDGIARDGRTHLQSAQA